MDGSKQVCYKDPMPLRYVVCPDYPSHLPFPPTTPEMLAALEQLKETVKRADIKILLGKDPLPPPNKESK